MQIKIYRQLKIILARRSVAWNFWTRRLQVSKMSRNLLRDLMSWSGKLDTPATIESQLITPACRRWLERMWIEQKLPLKWQQLTMRMKLLQLASLLTIWISSSNWQDCVTRPNWVNLGRLFNESSLISLSKSIPSMQRLKYNSIN